jgi:hypothetical protein
MADERRNRAGVRWQTMDAAAAFVAAERVVPKGAARAADPFDFDQAIEEAAATAGERQRVRHAARVGGPVERRAAAQALQEKRTAIREQQTQARRPRPTVAQKRQAVIGWFEGLPAEEREAAAQAAIRQAPHRMELIQQALEEVESREVISTIEDEYTTPEAELAWEDEDYELTDEERETWENATEEERQIAMEAWLDEEED